MVFRAMLIFLLGFSTGLNFSLLFLLNYQSRAFSGPKLTINRNMQYNQNLSNKLYNDVKVLCMVMTIPANHKKKAVHIKNTWGRRCNKLLFMTSETDPELETVILPVENSREFLWNKTKLAFKYLYDNHVDDYDYFVKADDDT